MKIKLFPLILSTLLIGCAEQKVKYDPLFAPIPTATWKAQPTMERGVNGSVSVKFGTGIPDVPATEKQLDSAYTIVLTGCQSVLSGYESNAARTRTTRVVIAIIGAIAGGAVPVVGTLSGSYVTLMGALGGISGLANSAQATLTTQGFTAGAELSIREGIRQSMEAALIEYTQTCQKQYNANTDFNGWYQCKSGAIVSTQAACISYAVQDPTVVLVPPTSRLGERE